MHLRVDTYFGSEEKSPHSDYNVTLRFLNVKSLQARITDSYCFFIKILTNDINDSFSLSHTHYTRDTNLFHIPFYSQKYTSSSQINILLTNGNNDNRDLQIYF